MSLPVCVLFGSLAVAQAFDSNFGSSAPVTEAEYDARLERGVELYGNGEFEHAETYFRNLTRTDPDRKEAHLWLGHALRGRGLRDEARQSFQRYSELAPEDPEGFFEAGRSYEDAGNAALAKLWYKKAQDVDADDERVRKALIRIGAGASSSGTPDGSSVEAPPVASTDASPETPATASPSTAPAAPRATDSGTAAPDGAEAPAAARHPFVQFWYEGVAGVTGARTVWWGRAIVIVFQIIGGFGSWQNFARAKEKFPDFPDAYWAFSALFGSAFTYVLLWGIPFGWNWAWLVGYALLNVMGTVGTLQAVSQAKRA